jgi:hypothetical protein
MIDNPFKVYIKYRVSPTDSNPIELTNFTMGDSGCIPRLGEFFECDFLGFKNNEKHKFKVVEVYNRLHKTGEKNIFGENAYTDFVIIVEYQETKLLNGRVK